MMKYLIIFLAISCFSYNLFSQNFNITIKVEGIKNSEGVIQIGIFNEEKGFPERNKVYIGAEPKAMKENIIYTFENLPKGKYAVAIFHDIDSNKKLNKNKIGLPTEGFGFSNISKIFGVPGFNEALIEVTSDKTVIIELNYL